MYRPLESKHMNRNSRIHEFPRVTRIETVPHERPHLGVHAAFVAEFARQQKRLTLTASPPKMTDQENNARFCQGIEHGIMRPLRVIADVSCPAALLSELQQTQQHRFEACWTGANDLQVPF